MVSGTMSGVPRRTMLEPDGRDAPGQQSSHWLSPDQKLLDDAGAAAGDSVEVSMVSTKEWIEPAVPEDLKRALSTSPKAEALWKDITPLARWDCIRWIRAVKTPERRPNHIEVLLVTLNQDIRRPY